MIYTTRLLIRPLTLEQLELYQKNDGQLELSLGAAPYPRVISAELQDALDAAIIPSVTAAGAYWQYSTLWSLMEVSSRLLVGEICFMGLPDEDGEIEIGYGLHEDFRKRGFMSEAVAGVLDWAKIQPGVRSVYAATQTGNAASEVVLRNNGFDLTGTKDDLRQWRKIF